MLAPLSWLKEYIDISLPPKELGEKLTEVGLGTEKITKTDDDVIFEFEVTPNRPDLLSIVGIAREIAAIEEKRIKFPGVIVRHPEGVIGKPKKILPLEIKTDFKINPRFSGIIIDGIKVKESPGWLKERLIKIGQRPINNIVDITNYAMFELGNPLHAFDYDRLKGHYMEVKQTKGGEKFESVDGISYHLPADAVVIADKERAIDLCGIKGGLNSGTFKDTKTIFIRVPVEVPVLIRRTSQVLGLRSEASSIFEKGVNRGGTVEALRRCVDLIIELAGGKIASKLYDLKEKDFKPWKLKLRLDRLNKVLGITIPQDTVFKLLENLNLSPRLTLNNVVETTIPTYRNDLKIEEDLIEEVARLYGYNNFPKTLPIGEMPTKTIPYLKDYKIDEKVKNILITCGFCEIYTYSLVSEKDLSSVKVNPQDALRVDNPVSREFEYLRPTLQINLIKALKQNLPNFNEINLFELGKVYLGNSIDKAKEPYFLSGISNQKSFLEIKGLLDRLFEELGVKEDSAKYIKAIEEGIMFELNYSELFKKITLKKTYVLIPKYPPIIEDLAIVIKPETKTGAIIETIKKQSPLISAVSLLDWYENTRTFHIVYQHKERNLTSGEVGEIRSKILTSLKQKFNARLKD